MTQRNSESNRGKHSTSGKTSESTTQATTATQLRVLEEVNSFLMETPGFERIEHLNWLLSDWLSTLKRAKGGALIDIGQIADITYNLTNVVTLIAKLDDITCYAREEILGGRIYPDDIFEEEEN